MPGPINQFLNGSIESLVIPYNSQENALSFCSIFYRYQRSTNFDWLDCMANQKLCCFLMLLNPVPNKPVLFTCVQHKSFKNTVGKGEIARDEQFLHFQQVFFFFFPTRNLSIWRTSAIFTKVETKVCKLVQFGRV